MRKLLLALAVAASVAGCAISTPLVQQVESFTVTQAAVDGLRSGYDGAFLAPAAHYRQLGYCAKGKGPTIQKPCADKAVVAKLRTADLAVQNEFDAVQGMLDAGQTSGLAAAYATLKALIQTAVTLATNTGVTS